MAGRYFGQSITFLTQLREKRQKQLLDLEGKSSSISAAGYAKSTTGFSIEELTLDLQEISFEIQRQHDLETGENNRPTCSYVAFHHDRER
jgi:hypothetical protein